MPVLQWYEGRPRDAWERARYGGYYLDGRLCHWADSRQSALDTGSSSIRLVWSKSEVMTRTDDSSSLAGVLRPSDHMR